MMLDFIKRKRAGPRSRKLTPRQPREAIRRSDLDGETLADNRAHLQRQSQYDFA
jgi:hypothetical protein